MPAAEIWTGLRISTPTSIRYGIQGRAEPQQWKKILALVMALTRSNNRRWRGIRCRSYQAGLTSGPFWPLRSSQ